MSKMSQRSGRPQQTTANETSNGFFETAPVLAPFQRHRTPLYAIRGRAGSPAALGLSESILVDDVLLAWFSAPIGASDLLTDSGFSVEENPVCTERSLGSICFHQLCGCSENPHARAYVPPNLLLT